MTSPADHAPAGRDADTVVATLPNGVRVVALHTPHLESANVSVFVRTGSRHESPALNGISHVAEHMAFKGTQTRDGRQINLDAERLGAEVDAHTDKDHTAYHLRGLARHALPFLRMLGDIVQDSIFPEAELERERQVILQELLEDEDDPMSAAFKLFDKACYGTHAMAQPVIGTRRNIERLGRDDLLGYVRRQYTGANVVVGVASPLQPADIVATARQVFGGMPRGSENLTSAPAYLGGTRALRMAGSSQSHVVLGYPVTSLREDAHVAAQLAAALFGEGMSSPLLHELRERRGLAYFAACSADLTDLGGQFVIEASTTPEHLDAFFCEVARLLQAQAVHIDPVELERARNQLAVRALGTLERPFRRLEEAAQDLFVRGHIRSRAQRRAALDAVSAEQVRLVFERMLAAPPAVALVGRLGAWGGARLQAQFGARLAATPKPRRRATRAGRCASPRSLARSAAR
jgi:predicted Zn-dependent peptidase